MGPLLPTPRGNRYILVIVDQFTKWVEAYPMIDQQGETVAKLVVGEFTARFGCPIEIPSFLQIREGILRGSYSTRCVACWE